MSDYKMVPFFPTAKMRQAMIGAYEDMSGDRLPDGDGSDHAVALSMYAAAIGEAPPFVVTDEFALAVAAAYEKAYWATTGGFLSDGDNAKANRCAIAAGRAAIEAVLGGGK